MKKSEKTMKKPLIGAASAAAATALAAVVKEFLPDVRRYLRMRRM
ncbi:MULTISPECIES: DUF6893 family small protein [Streptomyces]|uniref:DUF6893 family small protein n=1 Tax=Streptomyces maoxianensis TaxID=1459942 RepID=A0ABV9GF01_9ACTN|nr:hypothetical protein [Streptomyces sp. ISL-1]